MCRKASEGKHFAAGYLVAAEKHPRLLSVRMNSFPLGTAGVAPPWQHPPLK